MKSSCLPELSQQIWFSTDPFGFTTGMWTFLLTWKWLACHSKREALWWLSGVPPCWIQGQEESSSNMKISFYLALIPEVVLLWFWTSTLIINFVPSLSATLSSQGYLRRSCLFWWPISVPEVLQYFPTWTTSFTGWGNMTMQSSIFKRQFKLCSTTDQQVVVVTTGTCCSTCSTA